MSLESLSISTVRSQCDACVNLFGHLLRSPSNTGHGLSDQEQIGEEAVHNSTKTSERERTKRIRDEYYRLMVWSGNIGVYAKVPASADDRLQHDMDVRDLVMRLLDRLQTDLERVNQYAVRAYSTEEIEYSSDSSDSSIHSTEIQDVFNRKINSSIRDVGHTIDQLFSALMLIRKSTRINSMARVSNFDFRQNYADQYVELFEDFQRYVEFYLKFTYRRPPNGEESTLELLENGSAMNEKLFQRLKDVAVFRRKALILKARHNRKLQGSVETHFPYLLLDHLSLAEGMSDIPIQQRHPMSTVSRGLHSDKLSATVVSRNIQQETRAPQYTLQQAPKSTRSAIAQRSTLDIPPPPRILTGASQFVCYICGLIQEAHVAEEDAWK